MFLLVLLFLHSPTFPRFIFISSVEHDFKIQEDKLFRQLKPEDTCTLQQPLPGGPIELPPPAPSNFPPPQQCDDSPEQKRSSKSQQQTPARKARKGCFWFLWHFFHGPSEMQKKATRHFHMRRQCEPIGADEKDKSLFPLIGIQCTLHKLDRNGVGSGIEANECRSSQKLLPLSSSCSLPYGKHNNEKVHI